MPFVFWTMKKARLIPYIHFCPSKCQCLKADDNDIGGLCKDSKDIHLRQCYFPMQVPALPKWASSKAMKKPQQTVYGQARLHQGYKLHKRWWARTNTNTTRLTYNCAHLRLNNKKNKSKLSQKDPRDWAWSLKRVIWQIFSPFQNF